VTPGLLPRFQDGTTDMQELIRQLAESIANEVTGAEADELCGEGNSRNGYRERSPRACVGTLTLKVPKLRRGSLLPEDVPARHRVFSQA
jgi:transposase-like protein